MLASEKHTTAVGLTRWLALAACALLCGCAGDGPPPTDTSDWFATIQRTIFDQNCLGSGCHNAASQAGALNLSSGASYNSLVNVVPQNPAAESAGMLRVQPVEPQNSFLMTKITMPGSGEGSRMPLGGNPLSQEDIDSIEQWILAGAPRTGTRGPTPTPTAPGPPRTPTASATGTETQTPMATDTAPSTPTETLTPTDTNSPTPTVTGSPPSTNTASQTPTDTPTLTPSASPTETPTPGLFPQVQEIFNASCIDMFCHDLAFRSGNLVLVEGQSYAQLVDVVPDNAAARNAGLLRVDPGVVDNSFLVIKVEGPPPAMGFRMPFGKDPLSAEQIELIRRWIAEGAAPN